MTVTIKKSFLTLSQLVLACFICAIGTFKQAAAIEVQATANVRITQAISLSELQQIEFGSVASRVGQCTINQLAELSASNGLCAGDGTLGILLVGGHAGSRLNIVANPGSVEGITFNPELIKTNVLINNSGDAAKVPIAGSLEITAPLQGQHRIPFEIIADYE